MVKTAIETHGLTKRYGTFTAVDALDLHIKAGEVYGLLGPNGSGKTTTILMLLGLTEPTAGQARILGFDPVREPLKVKAQVGYLPDQVGFYNHLTASENLAYIARLIGLPEDVYRRRIRSALDRLGLSAVDNQPVKTFSHGMRQRLGVAELLLKDPQIIIMDEPTVGLDPDGARQFLKIIQALRDEGITVLLSSHLLHQVQQVCDRVGLFSRGRIVLQGTVTDLAQEILGKGYRLMLRAEGEHASLIQALNSIAGVGSVSFDGRDEYTMNAEQDLRAEAARAVVHAGGELKSLSIREPNLDDIYEQYFELHGEVEHVVAR